MQIHELPSASPSASDYIPIDNGTATRKATLSSIDMGSNEITFTSGDTSSPSSWQTVAVMASNTAANLMNAISKMVANIRWLYNRLGTSSTGTTATTVTGAIAEHSTKIGSADMGTTATTLTGAIAEVNDSVNTNTEDIATLNSNLGRLTSKAGSMLTQQQNLTTSPATVTCNGSPYNTGSVFTLVSSDGGFRCSRQGMVRVTGYIHVTGVTSGDEIGLSAGVYSGGWVYQSYSMRSKTVTVSIDIFVPVSENQIVYIRASNNSGARGAIDSAQLAVEWLSA